MMLWSMDQARSTVFFLTRMLRGLFARTVGAFAPARKSATLSTTELKKWIAQQAAALAVPVKPIAAKAPLAVLAKAKPAAKKPKIAAKPASTTAARTAPKKKAAIKPAKKVVCKPKCKKAFKAAARKPSAAKRAACTVPAVSVSPAAAPVLTPEVAAVAVAATTMETAVPAIASVFEAAPVSSRVAECESTSAAMPATATFAAPVSEQTEVVAEHVEAVPL